LQHQGKAVVWNQEVHCIMPTFQITYDDEGYVTRSLHDIAQRDGVSLETVIHRAVAEYIGARSPTSEPPKDFAPSTLSELFEGCLGTKKT